MHIPAEMTRNSPKWPKWPETPRNFIQGERGGYLIPVCIPVRDFSSVPVGTEQNIQLWFNPFHLPPPPPLSFHHSETTKSNPHWNSLSLFVSLSDGSLKQIFASISDPKPMLSVSSNNPFHLPLPPPTLLPPQWNNKIKSTLKLSLSLMALLDKSLRQSLIPNPCSAQA